MTCQQDWEQESGVQQLELLLIERKWGPNFEKNRCLKKNKKIKKKPRMIFHYFIISQFWRRKKKTGREGKIDDERIRDP